MSLLQKSLLGTSALPSLSGTPAAGGFGQPAEGQHASGQGRTGRREPLGTQAALSQPRAGGQAPKLTVCAAQWLTRSGLSPHPASQKAARTDLGQLCTKNSIMSNTVILPNMGLLSCFLL